MITMLYAPVVLLAFSLHWDFGRASGSVFVSLVSAFVIAGNLGILLYRSEKFIEGYGPPKFRTVHEFYASNDEISAYEWIKGNAAGKVILASALVSGRIPKYTSA